MHDCTTSYRNHTRTTKLAALTSFFHRESRILRRQYVVLLLLLLLLLLPPPAVGGVAGAGGGAGRRIFIACIANNTHPVMPKYNRMYVFNYFIGQYYSVCVVVGGVKGSTSTS